MTENGAQPGSLAAAPRRAMSWTALCALAVAAAGLGQAMQVRDGLYDPSAVAWLAVAVMAGGWAILGRAAAWVERRGPRVLLDLLTVLVVAQLATMARRPPIDGFPAALEARAMMLLGAGMIVAVRLAPLRHLRWIAPAMIGVYLLLGIIAVGMNPKPIIDVYTVHVEAVEELMSGRNPYAMTFSDPYRGTSFTYPPGMAHDGRLWFGWMYPPLSLVLSGIGQIAVGDFRYAHLLAMASAGAMIAMMGWRSGRCAGRVGVLAAGLLLFSPRALYFIQMGWTEALVTMLLAGTVLAAMSGRAGAGRLDRGGVSWKLIAALGLLLAIKQHMVLLIPAVFLLTGENWRAAIRLLIAAIALAALVTLPLALWDPAAFVRGVVLLQLWLPFRHDALSFPAMVNAWWGVAPSPIWGFVAYAAAMGVCLRRCPRSAGGFAMATGISLLAFFAFGKQAFCNYYMLVSAAFACAIAATAAAAAASPERPGGEAQS